MRIASVTLMGGVGLVMVAVATGSMPAFFIGTLTAGVGFGVGFMAALRTVLTTVSTAERAGLMAAFLVLSYCAFSLPALGAGFAAGRYGLTVTAEVYGVLLVLLAFVAGLASLIRPGAAR